MRLRWQSYGLAAGFITVLYLLYAQIAFSLEPTINVLGDVVGSGKAEIKAFDRWVSVADKANPFMDGANLRTGDGRMSIIMRDGVRMEMGKSSACEISGFKGNYMVHVSKGSLSFSVPEEAAFSVVTTTSHIEVLPPAAGPGKVSSETREHVRGAVSYDGRGTRVVSERGNLALKAIHGSEMQSIAAGSAMYVTGPNDGNRITPVSPANKDDRDRDRGNDDKDKDKDKKPRPPSPWKP